MHYKCHKFNDIHSFLDFEVSKIQKVGYQLFRKVLGASYKHSRYSVKFRLKSVHHEFYSILHIADFISAKITVNSINRAKEKIMKSLTK